jgi:pyruvate/2-oxoglutarate/acetoin dehydrogenase E1 component
MSNHNIKDREEAIISYRQAIFTSMDNALRENPAVIIMGQGVDDHKGTFGTTLGLAEKYGKKRVFDIPLSEESTTGIAIGASLNGLYPIQTHIRNDFSLLAMSQIINSAAKYKYMYGGMFEVPMLIRLIIGRSWGQGAQHSQSLQSLFAHIPGLMVIMPSHPDTLLSAYDYSINKFKGPVISLEHRLLYDFSFKRSSDNFINLTGSRIVRKGDDITVVASSIMVLEAQRCAEILASDFDIHCEVIDLHSISHYDKELILNSVRKTGRLLVSDTSWQAYGVSAEMCRLICENEPSILKSPVITSGMQPSPCPTTKALEDLFYPNIYTLTKQIIEIIKGKNYQEKLPKEQYLEEYKKFKGPF